MPSMPLQQSGVVYTGVSESITNDSIQNEKHTQQTQPWLSSTVWSFVESIPASPASAAESALANKVFMRMSSFSRVRLNSRSTVASTSNVARSGSAGVAGRVKRFFKFSFLVALFAVFCVFMSSHSSVFEKSHSHVKL